MPSEVVLYSTLGCHLCEQARAGLEMLASRLGFRLTEVDIHSDEALAKRWLFEIPVIEVDGRVVTQAPVNLDAVRRAVEAGTRG